MNTENICKALYALPGGVVSPRRQSLTSPIIITIVGIAFVVINYVALTDAPEALSMLMLTLGIGLLLYGALVLVMRLSNPKQVPYDNRSHSFFKYKERYFERELVAPIQQALGRGDTMAIDEMPTTNIAAVTLVEYRSKSGIRAYCLYEYGESNYRPITQPTILGHDA